MVSSSTLHFTVYYYFTSESEGITCIVLQLYLASTTEQSAQQASSNRKKEAPCLSLSFFW